MPMLSDRRLAKLNDAVVSGRIVPYIATWIVGVAVIGGVAVWILAPRGFGGLGDALWWSAQTVTTVGYGDVVPTTAGGRVIAVVVMALGVSAVSFLTAAVTSVFVTWHQSQLAERGDLHPLTPHERNVHESLERIEKRLDSLERRLS
jgi:voltage-gated potassium channel